MIEISQDVIEQIRDTINSLGPRIAQIVEEPYRRIVLAAAIRFNNGKVGCNAMSSLKLPEFSDYFQEDDYKTRAETYRILLEIKQRVIDYNNMINICISHLERDCSLSDNEMRDLEKKPARIMRQVIKLCEQIAGDKEYGTRTLQIIATLHKNHMQKDGYPDSENIKKFLKDKYENSEFSETISLICERYKHLPSVLLNILEQDVQTSSRSSISNCYPFAESFPSSTVRQKEVVDWFNFSLSVDGAASIPRLS